MKIEIETGSYNEKRYGKPWIAIVDFSSNPNGDFKFGTFVGDAGYEGVLILEVEPGDIVARGQKDHRARRVDPPSYYVVKQDGSLSGVKSKAEAYKLSKAKNA